MWCHFCGFSLETSSFFCFARLISQLFSYFSLWMAQHCHIKKTQEIPRFSFYMAFICMKGSFTRKICISQFPYARENVLNLETVQPLNTTSFPDKNKTLFFLRIALFNTFIGQQVGGNNFVFRSFFVLRLFEVHVREYIYLWQILVLFLFLFDGKSRANIPESIAMHASYQICTCFYSAFQLKSTKVLLYEYHCIE